MSERKREILNHGSLFAPLPQAQEKAMRGVQLSYLKAQVALDRTLTPEQRELFQRYHEKERAMCHLSERHAFYNGFKLGKHRGSGARAFASYATHSARLLRCMKDSGEWAQFQSLDELDDL